MAVRRRHVLPRHGEGRALVWIERSDLLLVHPHPLRDPHAEERSRRLQARGGDPRSLVIEVDRLPLRLPGRGGQDRLVGPTLLDMLDRRLVRWSRLQPGERQALEEAHGRPPGREFVVWARRDLATLWPPPGQETTVLPAEEENEDEDPSGGGRQPSHPFVSSLVSGGRRAGKAPLGFVRVTKPSTVSIAEHVVRLAAGLYGSIDAAHQHLARLARAHWQADEARALALWEAIARAPAGLLLETPEVAELRPGTSISQAVEREVLAEVCCWLGVDPGVAVTRPRGRPRGSGGAAEAGEVLRVVLGEDGTARAEIVTPYHGLLPETDLATLDLATLGALLGRLKADGLARDAELLEAWLDAARPDWRDELAATLEGGAQGGPADPCEVLGVAPDSPMAEITAAYRRAMRAVHPDLSGGASPWLARAVAEAYRTIRQRRAGEAQQDP